MKLAMFVIYDSKAELYNAPFLYQNDALAMRAARDLANDGQSQTSRTPEDFTLFKIGEYDDNTAQITPFDKFEVMARFIELKGTEPLQEAS